MSNRYRKARIRNIVIGIAGLLLIAAILILAVSRGDSGSNYTEVIKAASQVTGSNLEDDGETGGAEGSPIDVDSLPKVPVEPAP